MNFYSNGKLLLTAEYLVIDGAKSLALPTKYGQGLKVFVLEENTNTIYWKSFDLNNGIWLECEIDSATFSLNFVTFGDIDIATKLVSILQEAKKMNTSFLSDKSSLKIETTLDFDRSWGLGTSSTLINNIAKWANIDAFSLQFSCFGGSGYDIACASNDKSIIYCLDEQKNPKVTEVDFNPVFKDNLYFVHLNKKQNSRDAITNYKKQHFNLEQSISTVNEITLKMATCNSLDNFENLIREHESLLSSILKQPTVKELYFNDYRLGEIKSLGAWGGDFILATGTNNLIKYFKSKEFHTIIPFSEMIK